MALEARFRKDKDLAFLQHADWQDLKLLANCLIKDADGSEQWTGSLKKTLVKNIQMYPDSEERAYKESWKAIAAELQLFGGDTLINLARRKGVPYNEILHDVAKRVEVDFHKESTSIEQVEEKVLRTLFGRITTLNDIDYINQTLRENGYLGLTSLKSDTWNTVKKGMDKGSKLTTAALLLAKVNPVTATLTSVGAVKSLSSTAYRVTIPAVCIIAMMRKKYNENITDFNEF
jgi:uncharacterized protein YaaW (UPF0174 family)